MTFRRFLKRNQNIGKAIEIMAKLKVYKHTNAVTLRLKRLKMENSFDINNLVQENVKTKPYSSARDEFKDFDVAQMIFGCQ
jgi:hypothetical protein